MVFLLLSLVPFTSTSVAEAMTSYELLLKVNKATEIQGYILDISGFSPPQKSNPYGLLHLAVSEHTILNARIDPLTETVLSISHSCDSDDSLTLPFDYFATFVGVYYYQKLRY